MKLAIVGGGAAGFFLAVNMKEMMPGVDVTIFERSSRVLAKVAVSGGGRCNITNSFAMVSDLQQVYPRGARLMKRLMRGFSHNDAYEWWERHGVRLVTQDDECVFPESQSSQTVIDCLTMAARRYGVHIETRRRIDSIDELSDFDAVCVTTGGAKDNALWQNLIDIGHEVEKPLPSLFTFNIDNTNLTELTGLVIENTVLRLPGTKLAARGTLLITHWGISGPATLRLSSYAARHLAECNYQAPLSINWLGMNADDALAIIQSTMKQNGSGAVCNHKPSDKLQNRLWEYIVNRALGSRATTRWAELSRREINRLVEELTNAQYTIAGRSHHKDEFVTCGGIALTSVNTSTLESKVRRGLYFAGEVLDIDGVTGGFNFQAAWTTAMTVAHSLVSFFENNFAVSEKNTNFAS